MGQIRSLILETLLTSAAVAVVIVLLLDLAAEIGAGSRSGGCESAPAGFPAPLANSTDLDAAFRELIARNWLSADDRALCVGPDSGSSAAAMRRLGFSTAVGSSATACCGLPFEEASFDFAFSAALDRVRVPARVVLEMERVLRPGRVGAVLRLRSGPIRPGGLMKAAAPVASLLRFSDVIGARAVNGSTIVVFKKKGSTGSASRGLGRTRCVDAITRIPLMFNEIVEYVRDALVVIGGPSSQLA